jgi:hypothetical protein
MRKHKISAKTYSNATLYYVPMVEEGNLHPFVKGVSCENNVDTTGIINEYLNRFKDAWQKLAEK